MLFSQPLDKKFTKTPNVFFEEVLCAKGTTFNEAKLMGYLIRNTLGYNHKAVWMKVSRSQLSQNAQISYGSINPTIHSCIEKGWILEVKHGDKGREERYLFLRTPRNEHIVHGLKEGKYQLSDLGALTCEQEAPRTKHIHVPCTTNGHGYSTNEHDTYSLAEEGCSNLEQAPYTTNGEDPYSNSEHVNKPLVQEYQGTEASLKTITKKDKSLKDKNHHKTQQQQDVVVVQKRIMDLFNKRISRKNVEALIFLAERENVDLEDTIQNTYQYHTNVEACRNVFGAIKYALEHGEWDIPDVLDLYPSSYGTILQTQVTPCRVYSAFPVEKLKEIYGLA